MNFELHEIPGLKPSEQTSWKIRALGMNGRVPALDALVDWSVSEKADYNKIMKVMRIVGQVRRVPNPKHVKKSTDPKDEGAYEMRADKGHARLMFFYAEQEESLVVCTNHHWKGKGSQAQAFKLCAELRRAFLATTP